MANIVFEPEPGARDAMPDIRVPRGPLLGALAVVLVVPALHEGERGWWPWACVAGLVLGAMGWGYLRRGRGNAHDAA